MSKDLAVENDRKFDHACHSRDGTGKGARRSELGRACAHTLS